MFRNACWSWGGGFENCCHCSALLNGAALFIKGIVKSLIFISLFFHVSFIVAVLTHILIIRS
jgi:hypothetical protein